MSGRCIYSISPLLQYLSSALTEEILNCVVFIYAALLCLLSVPEVVTKYSNFISFPLYLNGRRINTLQVSRRALEVTCGGEPL